MQIVLVRHADAVPEGPGLPDEVRYLSAAGRRTARELGDRLASAGIEVGAALTSPLVRAVQTAELVTAAIGWAGVIEVATGLAPGGSLRRADEVLGYRAAGLATGALLVFGHEPSISALAEHLAGEQHLGSFRKAEACLVEDGVLCWRLTP